MKIVQSVLVLFILINLTTIQSQTNKLTIDYSLYSQLNTELSSDFSNEPVDSNLIYNYYKLNNETLGEFNEYLHFPDQERLRLKDLTKSMFEFAYDNYMKYAYPKDELDPIHCVGRGVDYENPMNININDALGDYSLGLVDSLTSLIVFGNYTKFKRAVKLLIDDLDFNKSNTVQVFEATIRILGGLLSAHLIATDKEQPFGDMTVPNYDNELLYLAHDLGTRLLFAFDFNKKSEIPHPRVNLKNGLPSNFFSNNTCTSGAGTLLLEFGVLGDLMQDPLYEKLARKAVYTIFEMRNNQTGLLGNELDLNGEPEWSGFMSGLGAGIDSYYEYLLKVFNISIFQLRKSFQFTFLKQVLN